MGATATGLLCENSLRLVLLGKTGVGKSAAGNALLAKKEFKSSFSDSSVTKDCARGEGEVAGRRVVVVDTPGLFDTKLSNEAVLSEIAKCIQLSYPGPHAFLLVLKVGRSTEEEKKTMQIIQEMFGEDALKYMMVLFTHRDSLDDEQMEDFFNNGPTGFKQLVESCGNRFHAINGKDLKDQEQIKELLEKVENMVKNNNIPFYASKFYEREKKRKETEAKLQKEIENLKKKNEEAMDDLKKKKNKEIDDLKKKNEEAMDDLKKKNKEIDDLKKEYKKAIEKLQQEKGCCIS